MFSSTRILIAAAVVAAAPMAYAAGTPEQQCQQGRYKAVAKYVTCEHRVIAKHAGEDDFVARSNCATVFLGSAWVRLQVKASGTGSTCDQSHYQGGGGTVTDLRTGLEWESKTDDGGLHDKDNVYTWTDPGDADLANADGDVWSFLAALNSGSCFAGHCDWRLPTRTELATIAVGTNAFDPFWNEGPFWSSTTKVNDPESAWFQNNNGTSPPNSKKVNALRVRVVRGGL